RELMEDVIKARESIAMTRENNTGLEDRAETTVLSEADRRASRLEGCNQAGPKAAAGHGAKEVIFYSTRSCLRCTILRAALIKCDLDWTETSMDSEEVIKNMRKVGFYAREPPVLRVNGRYWLGSVMFKYNGELNKAKLKEILGV
ncbi:MAG: hypothetical protein WCG94_05930, partial [Methanothrix sp.]